MGIKSRLPFVVTFASLFSSTVALGGPTYTSCTPPVIAHDDPSLPGSSDIFRIVCDDGPVWISALDIESVLKLSGTAKLSRANAVAFFNNNNLPDLIKKGLLRVYSSTNEIKSAVNQDSLVPNSQADLKSGIAYKDNCTVVIKKFYTVNFSCGSKQICEAVLNCQKIWSKDGIISGLQSFSCDASNCSDKNIQNCITDNSVIPTSSSEIKPKPVAEGSAGAPIAQ